MCPTRHRTNLTHGYRQLASDEGSTLSIGTVAAYSAKYSALVVYRILELLQY